MEESSNLDQSARDEDDDSSEALFNRWQQNHDQVAFQTLYERHVPRLRRFLRRQIEGKFEGRGLNAEAVEDILQDVFFAVIRCQEPVRSIDGLLHKAAKNYLLKHVEKATSKMRDHHRTISYDRNPGLGSDDNGHDPGCNGLEDPKAAPAHQQARIEADELMERLPPPEAKAVRLVDLEGHTIPSAAEAMNISESTTWSRVRSGRQRLKHLATTSLILLALLGTVANNCDLDVYMNVCTAETDEDEVCREDGGHHDSNKLCRKRLMRSLIRPDVSAIDRLTAAAAAKEITDRVAFGDEYPGIREMSEERQAVSVPSDLDWSWRRLEEGATILSFRVVSKQAVRRQSKVPRVGALQAA
jgi:RNA polymerase sigma factor (sigma-70 family)